MANLQKIQIEFDSLKADSASIDVDIEEATKDFSESRRHSDEYWDALKKLNFLHSKRRKIMKEMGNLQLVLSDVKNHV